MGAIFRSRNGADRRPGWQEKLVPTAIRAAELRSHEDLPGGSDLLRGSSWEISMKPLPSPMWHGKSALRGSALQIRSDASAIRRVAAAIVALLQDLTRAPIGAIRAEDPERRTVRSHEDLPGGSDLLRGSSWEISMKPLPSPMWHGKSALRGSALQIRSDASAIRRVAAVIAAPLQDLTRAPVGAIRAEAPERRTVRSHEDLLIGTNSLRGLFVGAIFRSRNGADRRPGWQEKPVPTAIRAAELRSHEDLPGGSDLLRGLFVGDQHEAAAEPNVAW
ncbi:hypothetical protein FHR96_001620 [Halomonas organivorans]|uniref:Uncharacterized protein n=1 Tax=Halomonas organivorans TaxID=257772 RepID=A0A7W5BX42_9GAMM|nr:hypothetical protein [Halomonas organivorans]